MSEQAVLEFQVLQAGKMGKTEDLSNFDKGQVVMAIGSQHLQNKKASLLGSSWYTAVNTYLRWQWFMAMVFPDGSGFSQHVMHCVTLQKIIQEWFKEHGKQLPGHLWDVLDQ